MNKLTRVDVTCKYCGKLFTAVRPEGKWRPRVCATCQIARKRRHYQELKEKRELILRQGTYTERLCAIIEKSLNKYPPRIRPLMKKQLEMYRLGEYEAETVHYEA